MLVNVSTMKITQNYFFTEEEKRHIVLAFSIVALPLSYPCYLLRQQYSRKTFISHCLARDWQRTCGVCQLLNQKFSASGTAAPLEMAMLYRRFCSDGQAGTLPRAVTMTASHIQRFHSCTEQDVHQSLSYSSVL